MAETPVPPFIFSQLHRSGSCGERERGSGDWFLDLVGPRSPCHIHPTVTTCSLSHSSAQSELLLDAGAIPGK